MDHGFGRMMAGQILLIMCCVFYVVWWSISYKPGIHVNRSGGINGVLLFITAVSGIAGLVLSVYGANTIRIETAPKLHGVWIVAGGIAAYVILLVVTCYAFERPVTTELLLINGWAVLELTVISSLNASGHISDNQFQILLCVIAAAYVISMILYVLYNKMDPMKAYYAAMIPLVTESVSMAVIVAMGII